MFIFSSWIILSILAGLASNAFNFFSRYILKDKDDPLIYAWYFEAFKLLIFGVIAIFDWKLIVTPQSILIFLGLGLSEFFGVYWYMKMHAHSHLSISTIISRTRLIWVPILAFLLFGETLKLHEYIGIIVLFAGISIVIAPKELFVDKGAKYANYAAFMVGLNLVILKMALPYASASVANALMTLPVVFLFPLFFKHVRTNMNFLKYENLNIKSFAIILNIVSLYLITWALAIGEAGKVIALYQSMMIFSVVAGIIFLNEREHITKKLLGSAITLVGVILLTSF